MSDKLTAWAASLGDRWPVWRSACGRAVMVNGDCREPRLFEDDRNDNHETKGNDDV